MFKKFLLICLIDALLQFHIRRLDIVSFMTKPFQAQWAGIIVRGIAMRTLPFYMPFSGDEIRRLSCLKSRFQKYESEFYLRCADYR